MPYCGQCGKFLNAGETCNCTSSEASVQTTVQDSSGNTKYDPRFDPYITRYANNVETEQKNSNVVIFVAIFAILCVVSLFAASVLVPAYYSNKIMKKDKRVKNIVYDAETLNKAANDALYELNLQEVTLQGMYFICSDKESNVAVPFDAELFYNELEDHLDKSLKECQYFIVIRNGKAEYTAAAYDWTKGRVNTFPSKNGRAVCYDIVSEGAPVAQNEDLDDIYWKAYDCIFKEE